MAEILGAEVDEEGYLLNTTDWTREIAMLCLRGWYRALTRALGGH